MFQNYLSRIYLKKHNQRCWFHWISNFGSRFGLANSDQKRDKFIRVARNRMRFSMRDSLANKMPEVVA